MNRAQEVIGTCAECGSRILWIPLFGEARDLGACEKCNEWRDVLDPSDPDGSYRRLRSQHHPDKGGGTPTAENINALPRPLRDYIHRLEANTDPQGEIRRAMIAEMQLAAVNKMLEERQWQPIETAPRRGETILVVKGRMVYACRWNPECTIPTPGAASPHYPWQILDDDQEGINALQEYAPTRWMPLPEPPDA